MDYNLTRKNSEKFISLYTPSLEEKKSGYTSPLLSKNFKDLPDTLIITAEYDPLRDDGEAYGNKLKEAGVQSFILISMMEHSSTSSSSSFM